MKAANKLVKDRRKGTGSAPQQKAGSTQKTADGGEKTGTVLFDNKPRIKNSKDFTTKKCF